MKASSCPMAVSTLPSFNIAEAEVPKDVTILGIDEDTVLALFKDELDLEHVRLYHLRR